MKNMKKRKNKKHMTPGLVFAYMVVLLFVFLCIYPFMHVLAYSVSEPSAMGQVTFYPKGFQLDAYKQILAKQQIWQSIKVSVIITLLGTSLSLVLTIFAAYTLSKKKLKGRVWMSGLILFTMYFGGGIIPTFMIVKGLGMYDTLSALYVPNAISVFNFIVMRTFFREIPQSLEEAAYLDGASDWKILTKVVLPLSVPIIATIGLFYAVGYWNDYFSSLLYIQKPDLYTLQLRLRSLLFTEELNSTGANVEGIGTQVMTESLKMACIVVGTIPIIAVYPWLQKYFVKGVMLGSVKG